MTSGTFTSFPVSSIFVDRATRQRKDLPNIDELVDSIARLGLINPIVIKQDGELIAGERRWTAIRQLGWTHMPVQFVEDLDELDLREIEFEENVKRVNLTWQEECEALAQLHELKLSRNEGWSTADTASSIGMSARYVQERLAVAKELQDEKISSADKFSTARNLTQRSLERRRANAVSSVAAAAAEVFQTQEENDTSDTPLDPVAKPIPLLNLSFHDWQPTYEGPKFNLVHCDFPYGINVADSPRQNSALADHYEDSPDTYWALVARLGAAMSNVVADSAHLVFWFSMDYYSDTVAELTRMGWKVNPFPLIWHKSDNAGIAPDTQRWPRRTYETALVASRGDRKLTHAGPRANSFAHPGSRDGAIHISEKPKAVLTHFLSMFCDEYSIVLDPTAGSGNAIKVAESLGAMSALGLELSPEFFDLAIANWES